MKFTGLVGLLSLAGPILGFLDTGAVFINDKLLTSSYIVESKELAHLINTNLCGANKPVELYHIPSLNSHELDVEGTFISRVHYDAEASVKDLSTVCKTQHTVKTVSHIDEIDMNDDSHLVIVQEMPKFKATHARRDTEDEISEEFEKAKSMASEAENDDDETNDEVHIFDEDESEPSASSAPEKATNGSLFNTYQFFTSGIFMCLIVSFMLLFILMNALSWVSSIEITYKSFDKQVDFEKKTE